MERIGVSDDFEDPDGRDYLSFAEAQALANKWFKKQSDRQHFENTGEVTRQGPFTVNDALDLKIAHAKKEGQHLPTLLSYVNRRIRPELGPLDASKLAKRKVENWLIALAESPRMRSVKGKQKEDGDWGKDGPSDDEARARKITANRILAILKHALNLAVDEGYIEIGSWRDVKPFSHKKYKKARIRFLNVEEQQRLVNVCPPDFRKLVTAALYTGSRYAPLTRLTPKDLNIQAGTIFIEKDKYSKARHVVLTAEALEWFKSMVAGLSRNQRIFTRDSVKRVTRKEIGNQWAASDQSAFMDAACEAAKLERLLFHELRHTYASILINAGVPLAFVSEQLGHVNTKMVEEHYGHLCPSAKAESIRKLVPALGIAQAANIAVLEIKRA